MGYVDIVGVAVGYAKRDFTLSNTLANLLPSMVFLWFGLCSVPVGVLMRRIGRKKTVVFSAFVTVAGLMLPLIHYNFTMLLLAFAILGIGNTILQVSLNPLLAGVVAPQQMASALTLGQFVKAISSAVGPILVAYASTHFSSWITVFYVYAATTLVSALWLMQVAVDEPPVEKTAERSRLSFGLLRDRTLLMFFFVIALSVGFEIGLMGIVPKYLQEQVGLSLEEGGYANTLYYFARISGTFLGVFLLSRVPVIKFFVTTMALGTASLLVFIIVSDRAMLYGSLFVTGLACANIFPIALSQAIRHKPQFTDEISALMIVGVAGGALLPPIIGVVADLADQRTSLLIPLSALLYILGSALYAQYGSSRKLNIKQNHP